LVLMAGEAESEGDIEGDIGDVGSK